MAAVSPSPLRLVGLDALPPLTPAAVQDDLHFLVLGEISLEVVPKVGLGAGDDEEVSDQARGIPSGDDAEPFDTSKGSPSGRPTGCTA